MPTLRGCNLANDVVLLCELWDGVDRGREGSAPPLPPNRTCGFPAYGSPVRGFLFGIELTERGLLT